MIDKEYYSFEEVFTNLKLSTQTYFMYSFNSVEICFSTYFSKTFHLRPICIYTLLSPGTIKGKQNTE